MPTIFSKWNNKSLKPLTKPLYNKGISSTDLHSGTEDARQLQNDSEVDQYLESREQSKSQDVPAAVMKSDPNSTTQAPDISTWKAATSQQSLVNPMAEFGAGRASHTSQRASTGKPSRRISNARGNYSASTLGAHPSKLSRKVSPSTNDTTAVCQPPSYGYTTYGWDTQMDVSRATEIVLACGQQIRTRGLDLPLIFSSMALDLSSHSITSLLKSLVHSPSAFFTSDVTFANPHDLAAVIKWTLSRLGRVVSVSIPAQEQSRKGNTSLEDTILVQQRGFLDLDLYLRWAAAERASDYPEAAFSSFSDSLASSTLALLVSIFSLLSSTTSYSHKNGMTPSRLSRLFGVLLFGLPEDETFEKTYESFVQAGNATEHLLLAYIRDCRTTEKIPTRLMEHIKDFPAMLSPDSSQSSGSVLGVPITHVNRTVRLYSLDLIETACEMEVAGQSVEWQACCSTSDINGKDPQLSDRFKKLINVRGGGKKQGRGQKDAKVISESEVYGSLVDKQWGDFMDEGFSAPDESKLAFDLRESERKARKKRPDSMQWSTFEESGFVMKDDGLDSVLSFDDDIQDELQNGPAERAELMEKLRKTNKMMPAFPYDTTPYIVSSPTLDQSTTGQWAKKPISRFDEVFAEVYADILLGNGWSNRDEQTHRNANFVIVQYKSRPTSSSTLGIQVSSSRQTMSFISEEPDDRNNAAWFVVEEIVPAKYRSEMEALGRGKWRSLPGVRKLKLFKSKKKEETQVKPNQSILPPSSFEELFKPGMGGLTKRMQLNKDPAAHSSRKDSGSTIRPLTGEEVDTGAGTSRGASKFISTIKRNSTFRSKPVKNRKRLEEDEARPPIPPSKETLATTPSFRSENFETRSLHDPESDAFAKDRSGKNTFLKAGRSSKRMSKDDTWLDVMIRTNGFRMAGQDATAAAARPVSLGEAEDFTTPRGSRTNVDALNSSPSRINLPPSDPEEEDALDAEEPTSIAAIKRKVVPEEDDTASQVSHHSLHAAGWTRDGAPSNFAPVTPPRQSSSSASPLMHQMSNAAAANIPNSIDEDASFSGDSGAQLAYLKPVMSRITEVDDKEKAREAHIQAAKNRAKELRARLNPVAAQELDTKTQTQSNSAFFTPVGSPNPSPLPAVKDDPFSKDRFSGRVASVANRFGGGVPTIAGTKPTTPPGTGSPTPGSSMSAWTVDRNMPNVAKQYSLNSEEPSYRRSAEYSIGDIDSIYPEDAASNFSRDTFPDEEISIRNASSVRPGGSIAASSSPIIASSSSDKNRLEEEDEATSAMPSFRVPYQPGMPLSNLEEESESIVSGSNL